jgi:hypothetical protein
VAGCCECSDEHSGSCTTELVNVDGKQSFNVLTFKSNSNFNFKSIQYTVKYSRKTFV